MLQVASFLSFFFLKHCSAEAFFKKTERKETDSPKIKRGEKRWFTVVTIYLLKDKNTLDTTSTPAPAERSGSGWCSCVNLTIIPGEGKMTFKIKPNQRAKGPL